MTGRTVAAGTGRGWPLFVAAWLVGLIMGLALASFLLWNRSPLPVQLTVTATVVPDPSLVSGEATTPPTLPAPLVTATPVLSTPTEVPSDTPIPASATPSAIPSPTPRVTPAPPGAAFGLAWFHKPPDDGTSA